MNADPDPPAHPAASMAEQTDNSTRGGPVTSDGHYRDVLNKARMAQFIRVATSDDAKAFVADLAYLTMEHEAEVEPRKRKRKAVDHRSFEKAVGAFSADLLYHSSNAEASGFMYRAANREALGETYVSSYHFDQLVSLWLSMGLMEATGFIRIKEEWEGQRLETNAYNKARRFRALPSMIALAENYGLTPTTIEEHFRKNVSRLKLVTIRDERRDGRGKRSYPQNIKGKGEHYEAEKRRVKRINDCLSQSGFDLGIPLMHTGLNSLIRRVRLFSSTPMSDRRSTMGRKLEGFPKSFP